MVFPKSAFNLQGNKAGVQKNPGRKDAGCVASEMDHEPQGTEGCPKHWLKALQEVRNWVVIQKQHLGAGPMRGTTDSVAGSQGPQEHIGLSVKSVGSFQEDTKEF